MANFDLVWLLLALFILVSVAIFLTYGIVSYKKESKQSYSFLNCFPYEFMSETNVKQKSGAITTLVVVSMASFAPLAQVLSHLDSYRNMLLYVIALSILFVLQAIAFAALVFVPARFNKAHRIITTCYLSLVTLGSACVAIYSSVIAFNSDVKVEAIHLTLTILLMILTILMIVIVFNPRLKDWAKLDKIMNQDGSVELKRPRFFPLAYSEWATFLVQNISLILFMLSLLKFN